jgi:hypothetical protein
MNQKINTNNSISHVQLVERYIVALSHAMTTGILRPEQLVRVQQRLDHIERDLKQRFGTIAEGVYGPMVELQALIHIANGQHHLVPVCIEELENLPREYRVRSAVFAEAAQKALQASPSRHEPTQSHPAPHTQPSHHKRGRSKRKLALVSVVLLLVVGFSGFVVLTGKLNPVAIAKQYTLSQSLRAKYQACTEDLLTKKANVDTNSPESVSQYNDDFAKCEAIRTQQNTAADVFHSLIAFGDSSATIPPQ